MTEQKKEIDKIDFLSCRWLPTPDDNVVLGVVMVRDSDGVPFVKAATCSAKRSAVDNAAAILERGGRIYATDANVIQAFLQDKKDSEIFKVAEGGHPKKIVFYRWIQWVLELMGQEQEYGHYLIQDPNWARCFEDEMSPTAALGEAVDAGIVIQKEDKWVVVDEAELKEMIGKAIADMIGSVADEVKNDVKPAA